MSNIIETLADQLEHLDGKADIILSNGSIGSFLNNFIVTPRIVVSESLRDNEVLDNIIDFNLDVFGLMYTRVFDILLSIYGYDSRFAIRTLGNGTKYSLESYDEPVSVSACEERGIFPLDVSLEKDTIASKLMRELELSSNIKTKEGKDIAIRFKMLLKATLVYTDPQDIYTAIDTNGDKVSFSARLDQYRSGEISFVNLLTSNDIIKEYKKNRLKEKSNFLKFVEARRKKNTKTIAIRQTVDMSKMFQMIIISKKEKERIEKLVAGKMVKDRIKDKVLDSVLSMSITSVDDDYEMIDFFLHEIPEKIELTYKEIGKKGADSTSELLKWLITNK